jgi:hypothetical protein
VECRIQPTSNFIEFFSMQSPEQRSPAMMSWALSSPLKSTMAPQLGLVPERVWPHGEVPIVRHLGVDVKASLMPPGIFCTEIH